MRVLKDPYAVAIAVSMEWMLRELALHSNRPLTVVTQPQPRLPPGPSLTPRELEIVALATAGATTVTMARRLGISAGTVKHYLHSIYKKLDVKNRVELILAAPLA